MNHPVEDFHWSQALSSDMSYTGAFSSPTRPAKTHVPKLRFTQLNPSPPNTLLPGTSSCACCIYSTAPLHCLPPASGPGQCLWTTQSAASQQCSPRPRVHVLQGFISFFPTQVSHSLLSESFPVIWQQIALLSASQMRSAFICWRWWLWWPFPSVLLLIPLHSGQYVVNFVSSIPPGSRYKPSDQC